VLPFILGIWLVFCGVMAARGQPNFEVDIMTTAPCRAFTSCLGDRLSPDYEKNGDCILCDSGGKLRVSLLALVVFVLLLVDFLLEIDVVLTKIEELPNPYIAFTSSAVAAFSIPELFFVSKGLLKRFVMLKYGIGFVLVLFGAQMLLSSFYILKPMVACCIIIGVLVGCVLTSSLLSFFGSSGDASGHAGPALADVGQGCDTTDATDTTDVKDVGQDTTEEKEEKEDKEEAPEVHEARSSKDGKEETPKVHAVRFSEEEKQEAPEVHEASHSAKLRHGRSEVPNVE